MLENVNKITFYKFFVTFSECLFDVFRSFSKLFGACWPHVLLKNVRTFRKHFQACLATRHLLKSHLKVGGMWDGQFFELLENSKMSESNIFDVRKSSNMLKCYIVGQFKFIKFLTFSRFESVGNCENVTYSRFEKVRKS